MGSSLYNPFVTLYSLRTVQTSTHLLHSQPTANIPTLFIHCLAIPSTVLIFSLPNSDYLHLFILIFIP